MVKNTPKAAIIEIFASLGESQCVRYIYPMIKITKKLAVLEIFSTFRTKSVSEIYQMIKIIPSQKF